MLGVVGVLATFFVFGAMVNAAAPAQENGTRTPGATRDVVRQATRRVTRGLEPLITPEANATRDPIRQATRRATRGLEPLITPEATATTERVDETGNDAAKDAAAEDALAEDAAINPVTPGVMTSQIVIFNPDTSGAATVRVEVYNSGGVVAFSRNLNVSANGAQLVTLPSSLGTNFQGGAQISSDKNVQAIVVGSNATKTARDSYEGTMAPALDVILPFVRHLAANTQNTVLAIQNTTDSAATVAARFYHLDGSTANTQNLNIAAHQSVYLNTNTLFPGGTFVGSARITSNQNIAVAAQTLYYKDTAALTGISASDGDSTLFLNQAERKVKANGVAVNWSEIFVRNIGANATSVTLDFYSSAGVLVTSSPATAVAPNGLAQFLLNDAAFAALGNSYSGWVKIRSSGEVLTAVSLQAFDKGKRLYRVNAPANSVLGNRYVCGDTSRMTTQNSRISILNTDGAVNARVLVRLYDKTTGAKVVQTKVRIAPNSAGTVLLSDSRFAAAGTNYQGMTLVQTKGTPAKLVVTVDNPYGSTKPLGTSSYACSKL